MALQQIFWYDDEGVFRRLRWDNPEDRPKSVICEFQPKELVPVGDGITVAGDGRTARGIAETVHESLISDHPEVNVYRQIQYFGLAGCLPHNPNLVFRDDVTLNFYYGRSSGQKA